MTYPFNAWYMAAWSEEVGEGFFARTLLDVPVMLYRDEGGRVIAMHDACPHRFAPLSVGKLVDGKVRCGYHGLEFDSNGDCVGSCIGGAAPKAARVRTFPIVEQDSMIWIWMGDQPAADPKTIMRFPFISNPDVRVERGTVNIKADYRLVMDNLMDLTHVALLHPTLNSFGGGSFVQPKFRCFVEDEDVVSEYIVESTNTEPGVKGPVSFNSIRWNAPGSHYLENRVTPGDAYFPPLDMPSSHCVTPETSGSAHDFWSSVVPNDALLEVLKRAFEFEDKPMIESVQKRMAGRELFEMSPLLLAADASAVRVRRKLDVLIERKTGTSPDERSVTMVEGRGAEHALSI